MTLLLGLLEDLQAFDLLLLLQPGQLYSVIDLCGTLQKWNPFRNIWCFVWSRRISWVHTASIQIQSKLALKMGGSWMLNSAMLFVSSSWGKNFTQLRQWHAHVRHFSVISWSSYMTWQLVSSFGKDMSMRRLCLPRPPNARNIHKVLIGQKEADWSYLSLRLWCGRLKQTDIIQMNLILMDAQLGYSRCWVTYLPSRLSQ